MRIALLRNPESGSGEAVDVAGLLRSHGAEVRPFGLDDASAAATAGAERIVVAGGDGSIGCAAEAAARAGVPLAVVPAGTANDFARFAGLPDGLEEACRLAVRGSATRRLELAWMGTRPFVNVASLGLPPAAAKRAHGLKRLLGPLAYAVGGVGAALAAHPVRCEVACDGRRVYSGAAWQVSVACSGAFGAGSDIEADPTDGLLDAVAIEAGPRVALARRAYGLRAGRIGSQSGVHTHRAKTVELDVPPDTAFNVDGEVVRSGPVSFRAEAGAVRLVVG